MSFILEFEDVHYTYPGHQAPALQGTTLHLPGGRKVAVLGRNGSGKTTLFLHANGILQPDSGTVCFAGQPVHYDRRSLRELRQQVGLVFQNPEDQLFSANVMQDISFGPLNLGLSQAETRQRIQVAAELCRVTHLLERPTHALSGGEKARIALAGVLAMEPDVLLVDELVAGLDPWMRRQVFTIFHRLAAAGRTVVLATHDIDVARYWADLVVIIEAGQVLATNTPAAIFADQALLDQTGLAQPWYLPFTDDENLP